MILFRYFAVFLIYIAIFNISGCANISRLESQKISKENSSEEKFQTVTEFRGRLALRIDGEQNQEQNQPQSFSGSFDLTGNTQTGALLLYSPLGSTVAALNWRPGSAQLDSGGAARQFESLDAMVKSAAGAELPIAGLFAWLNGRQADLPGWSADLSRWADGRITARRASPAPQLELRIILD